MIRCSRCQAELPGDARFCCYCGYDLQLARSPVQKKGPVDQELLQNDDVKVPVTEPEPTWGNTGSQASYGRVELAAPKTLGDKLIEKLVALWAKLSLYGKVVTVCLTLFALMGLVALLAKETWPLVISIVQIVGTVCSMLMRRGIIPLEKKQTWLLYLVLVVAILLTVLNVMSYSWGGGPTGNADVPQPA